MGVQSSVHHHQRVSPHPEGGLLFRIATCGSVDDGKSTLIGRLLYDCKAFSDDQEAAARLASQGRPCGPEGIDFSLLLDGLISEREQGITIDVAHLQLRTPSRIFLIADSPGHEQYTRNMATAASTAEAAIVIVDARKGVLPQTNRHLSLLKLFGVRHVCVVVNKIDLLGFNQSLFESIAARCQSAASSAGLPGVDVLPASAILGANVANVSKQLAWFRGPTVLKWMESLSQANAAGRPFRMPIQWVNRASADFRGYSGVVVSGHARIGDRIAVMPSGRETCIEQIYLGFEKVTRCTAGQSVTITLTDQVEAGRGAILSAPEARPMVASQFRAHIAWFANQNMFPGRSYLLRIGTNLIPASITKIEYRVDLVTQLRAPAKQLSGSEIGVCNVATEVPVPFDPYGLDPATGCFILIDELTSDTLGAGTIDFALRRATNISWQRFAVDRDARSQLNKHRPAIVWFTGLSGAGKSTIADLLECRLAAEGYHTFTLDGDNVRHGLNKDLGFTEADRIENVRRVAEVARLMADAGLIVLVTLISPFRRERAFAREISAGVEFMEVFVDAPLAICERRDPKGLYRKARSGDLKNFTGFDMRYEVPECPELILASSTVEAENLAEQIYSELKRRSIVTQTGF